MAVRTSRGNTLSSLDRGLAVLHLIARRGEVRLAELAKELDTSRTTIFRVLKTLRSHGFAEHVAERHTYRLGPSARSLAALATQSAITRLAEAPMADLRNATGETVNLVGVHGSRLVYEAVLEGGYALRSLPSLGMTVAAHCSALGKAVLAESPVALREVLLGPEPYQRFTEKTIITRRDLDAELEATRRRGYAIDEEEIETGLTCVAAVIGGTAGRPAGAISISGLTGRMHRLDLPGLGERLHVCCAAVGAAFRET
jgi:DNA-binding IclR family transcriptional regulator